MEIQLERVPAAKKEALFRLLQYSLFEESSTDQNEIGDDALFDYPWFDFYFTEPEREAYFIREKENGKLLGFVMINTYLKKASNTDGKRSENKPPLPVLTNTPVSGKSPPRTAATPPTASGNM